MVYQVFMGSEIQHKPRWDDLKENSASEMLHIVCISKTRFPLSTSMIRCDLRAPSNGPVVDTFETEIIFSVLQLQGHEPQCGENLMKT